MNFIKVAKDSGIATVTLSRGKVNAINEAFIEDFKKGMEEIVAKKETKKLEKK